MKLNVKARKFSELTSRMELVRKTREALLSEILTDLKNYLNSLPYASISVRRGMMVVPVTAISYFNVDWEDIKFESTSVVFSNDGREFLAELYELEFSDDCIRNQVKKLFNFLGN